MTVRHTSAEAYRGLSHPVSDASIIAAYIRNAGRTGLTRREIADGLQMDISSVSGRVNEMLALKEQSPIYETDETRVSRTGRKGVVIIHSDFAPGRQQGLFS